MFLDLVSVPVWRIHCNTGSEVVHTRALGCSNAIRGISRRAPQIPPRVFDILPLLLDVKRLDCTNGFTTNAHALSHERTASYKDCDVVGHSTHLKSQWSGSFK
eukprot:m.485173 g.485173  ORF g.485173 m.485173 type:complete len:103 (-) comp73786_c0_seq1:14-322(-)